MSEALCIFGECSTMRAGSLRGNIPLCSTAFGDQMKSTSFCFLDGLIMLTPYSLAGEWEAFLIHTITGVS